MANLQTPEERLCSRSWRLKNSAWLLWSICSAGLFTGVGFLIHAIAMKSKKMYIVAGAWILAAVVYAILASFIDTGTKANPSQTIEAKLLSGYITALFIGGIAHSALTNRSWLRWKANNSGSGTPWYASGDNVQAPSQKQQNPSAEAFSQVGIGNNSLQSTGLNINSASVDQLIEQGFDAASASKIVKEKTSKGPYTSQDDLLQRSGVAPHVVLSAGSVLTYETPEGSATSSAPQQSDNSPSNRRKLDF